MNVKFFDEAMKIPPRERVVVAELMLASIEHEDEGVKKTWLKEVKDRMESVRNGTSSLLDFNRLYVED